jgi:hypothetical protein
MSAETSDMIKKEIDKFFQKLKSEIDDEMPIFGRVDEIPLGLNVTYVNDYSEDLRIDDRREQADSYIDIKIEAVLKEAESEYFDFLYSHGFADETEVVDSISIEFYHRIELKNFHVAYAADESPILYENSELYTIPISEIAPNGFSGEPDASFLSDMIYENVHSSQMHLEVEENAQKISDSLEARYSEEEEEDDDDDYDEDED